MTRAGDAFDSCQKVRFAGIIGAPILFTELLYNGTIGRTQIFPNNLFSDVTANIFAVVAGFLNFDVFRLGFKQLGLFPFSGDVFVV